MFMTPGRAARCASAALGMFAVLAACDRHAIGAAAQPYEIVTQMRPESPGDYMRMHRQAHTVCAIQRTIQNLPPPPPLLDLPPDFVMKRSTYLSSGSDYLIRHEEFEVDSGVMTPEQGCKARIVSAVTEVMVRGGQVYRKRRESDGHTEVAAPTPLPPHTSDGAAYTEKRTVGGIVMRCTPASLHTDMAQELCAADAGAGVLLDGLGDPIVLRLRGRVPIRNMVVLTEPVSVQIGKPVPKERIALSGAK